MNDLISIGGDIGTRQFFREKRGNVSNLGRPKS